ncbi:MAG: ComF family protein [bacterium]|nr:ComF family protein [bacterium]
MLTQARALGKRTVDGLLRLLYPPGCQVCCERLPQGQKIGLCPACWRCVELIKHPWCGACGKPLEKKEISDPQGENLCLDCRVSPFSVTLRGTALYTQPLIRLLYEFKYDFWPSLADQLGDLFVERAHALFGPWRPEVVVPVPLHVKRLRWRGFNQSRLLAKRVAAHWGVPLAEPLVRVRNTIPQATLPAEARLTNVAGAFAVRDPGIVAGRRVCLVDDVSTTGSTILECGKVLREAGATEVRAYVLARP